MWQAGATITFAGQLFVQTMTTAVTTLNMLADMVVNEVITLEAGNLSIGSGASVDMAADATIEISGGTIGLNGGTLGFSGNYHVIYTNGSAVAGVELSGGGLQDVTIDVGTHATVTLTTGLEVEGTLALVSGELVLNGHDLTITTSGDVTSSLSGSVTSGLLSDISIHASGGTTGSLNLSTGSTVGNLTIDVDTGSVPVSGHLVITGALELESGTLVIGSNDLTVHGDIAATGSGTISAALGSDIVIAGLAAPAGAIGFVPGGAVISNLTIDIATGGSLVIDSDLEVKDTVNLINGHVQIGDNQLVAGVVLGASADGYVIVDADGSLSLQVMAGASDSTVFPVGTGMHYVPLAIGLNAGSPSGLVSVGVGANVLAEGTSGYDISLDQPVVDVTWHVGSNITTGLDMNIKAMWSVLAEVNAFDRAMAYVSHYTSGHWDVAASASAQVEANGMFSLERTHVTSLSPFAVFDEHTATSTEELASFPVNLYPNPASSVLTIQTGSLEEVRIEVVNIIGRVVADWRLSGPSATIPVAYLNQGSYFVRLYSGEELVAVERFIKM
jgi:hypothetical protein